MHRLLALLLLVAALPVAAQERVLFTGIDIFDGTDPELRSGLDVLVEDGRIAAVGAGLAAEGATIIDGGGRVMIPGLTDAHVHLMQQDVSLATALGSGLDYLTLVGARAAEEMLLRGFTTVRDMGGPVFGLKRAIDTGLVPGPRIYPSGALLGQTSGHSDFRLPQEIPAPAGVLSTSERLGFAAIADGVPEVRKRAREILRMGASQLKVMAGGGVSSSFDPLDVRQYSRAEMEAAVDAAAAWNTYVAVHAYTPKAVRAAVEAGVQVVEHGQMIDPETAALMAERGVWLSLQPFLDDAYANPQPEGSPNRVKQLLMTAGTDQAYALARSHGIEVAFGTDYVFAPGQARFQGAQLAKMERWYAPWEVLRMATADNHRLFKLSGPRDPYPGDNGVIQPGAHADLILVDGNPLQDLSLVANAEAHFDLIMKGGVIYKSVLD